jgi:glycine dehydrogenase subunit 1
MPFIPHTEEEVRQMLAAIGAATVEDLFDEIPQELRFDGLKSVPAAMSEMEVAQLMEARAQ